MDHEDIRCAIRKRFGTVAAFERANALPAKSVSDIFRGRKSARVQQAIDSVLKSVPVDNYRRFNGGGKL